MAAWCLHIIWMVSPLWPCWSGISGEPAGEAVGCLVEAADGRQASMVWSALIAEVGSYDALGKGASLLAAAGILVGVEAGDAVEASDGDPG